MNLSAWMVDSVTVKAVASVDSYGKPTLGSSSTVACRIESKRQVVRRLGGQEALAEHIIYTTTAVALSDRIWLPGASTSNDALAKIPLSVTANHDKRGGFTLYEVTL